MKGHVVDTVTGIVWGLQYFTEDGDPVLYQSTYAVSSGDPYNLRGNQVVPREVFEDRFVKGFDNTPYKPEGGPDVEPGYLPGYRP